MTDIKDIKSPCQSICIFEEDTISRMEYCIGCYRTVSEIQNWYDLSDEIREEINNALARREEKLS